MQLLMQGITIILKKMAVDDAMIPFYFEFREFNAQL
jgi:hypothetical protein